MLIARVWRAVACVHACGHSASTRLSVALENGELAVKSANDNHRQDPMAQRWAQGFALAIWCAIILVVLRAVALPFVLALGLYITYKLAKFAIAI